MSDELLPELHCKELVEIVTDYLEGAMSSAERARFEAHLAICDGCEVYLERMRTVVAISGRLDERVIEPAMKDKLLASFRSWRAPGGRDPVR